MTQSEAPRRVDPPWKVQERRCRRKAQRQGFEVQRRMWASYRAGGPTAGAYQVADVTTGVVVAGSVDVGDGMTLDEVETFLAAAKFCAPEAVAT